MHAWYLIVSPSAMVSQSLSERFKRLLGSASNQQEVLNGSVIVADYCLPESPSRLRVTARGLYLDDGGDEGSGQVQNIITVVSDTPVQVQITTDVTGLFPVHHYRSGSVFVASSNLHALAAALELSLDPVGELEFFGLGYTVGERTLYREVSRLRPSSVLTYDGEVKVAARTDETPLYVDGPALVSRDDAPEAVWQSLLSSCRAIGETVDGPVGVFLSGGLDSRMVIAGLDAVGVPAISASHGQSGLHEMKLAAKVAARANIPFNIAELGPLPLLGEVDELTELFYTADNILFPWWRHTAQALTVAGATTTATGYLLDASLGGHFHDEGRKSDRLKRRLRSSVIAPSRSSAGFLDSESYIDDFVTRQLASIRGTLSYRNLMLSSSSSLRDPELLDQVEADILGELDHYRATGTGSPARLKERYLVDNRARKYAFTQELIARRWMKMATPTADVKFLRLLSSLPSHWLLDHHLYYKLMRTHTRPYAALAGSNSPLPLLAPTFTLEIGRALRNRFDRLAMKTTLRTRGQRQISRYNSVNYEDVARRPGADKGVREILNAGRASNYDPAGSIEWLEEIAAYKRPSLNMVPVTILATLQLSAEAGGAAQDLESDPRHEL